MKKLVIILLTLVAATGSSFGQNLIAVQNGGEPTFYQQVDDVIVNAQDGDTIYIPGGTWVVTKPITKRLHLAGVGHNPDATDATFATTLAHTFTLADGANNGSLTGLFIRDGFNSSNATVTSYTVSRCRIANNLSFSSKNSNFMFFENILEGSISSTITGTEFASNFSFSNNFIGYFYGGNYPNNSVYKNNIFTYSAYFISTQYSLFENNIFVYFNLSGILNSTFKNNLFVAPVVFPVGTNVGSNNIDGQEESTIFVNQEGANFNYAHDYHLQTSSPGKNAGTDGTDVGIYGGIYPWKEGSIPFNPHFETIQISPKTDDNGNLNVNIKVVAQER